MQRLEKIYAKSIAFRLLLNKRLAENNGKITEKYVIMK